MLLGLMEGGHRLLFAINWYGNVTKLKIDNLLLEKIPEQIFSLSNLKELSLQNIGLSCIPESITTFVGLTALDLSSNIISYCKPIAGLKGLTKLLLDKNQITDLSPLKGLSKLILLSFNFNHVSDLSPLKGLTKLDALYFDSNQISNLEPLKGLKKLTSISAGNNQIPILPKELLQLRLQIEWKQTSANALNLMGNPLKLPPSEIVQLGHEAVVDYFKSIKKGSKAVERGEGFACGRRGSG